MLRIGFAKTIAVVWTDPMAYAFEDQAGGVLLSEVAVACAERSLDLLLLHGGAASGAMRGQEEQIKYYVRAPSAL